jgi:hypothetical protein
MKYNVVLSKKVESESHYVANHWQILSVDLQNYNE